MNGNYPITLNGTKIGDAYVYREGLYYKIICRCHFPDNKPWRLKVYNDQKEIDLGICVGTAHGRGLETRIPIKSLDRGVLSFCAYLIDRSSLYTVCENEPFDRISQVLHMRLSVKNGRRGLELR